jgi:hypothetical protein
MYSLLESWSANFSIQNFIVSNFRIYYILSQTHAQSKDSLPWAWHRTGWYIHARLAWVKAMTKVSGWTCSIVG